MRILMLSFLLLISSSVYALEEIEGAWKYKSFVYDGVPYPPSNPDLDMMFSFDGGISVLRWSYKGDPSFCERKAVYAIEGQDVLFQKNVWAHPGNHSSCAKDPDMQLGRESRTVFRIDNNQLQLILQLSDKPYIYIFERAEEKYEQSSF